MCKLCNSNGIAIPLHPEFKNVRRLALTQTIINIVYEYTNDTPCRQCISGCNLFIKNNPQEKNITINIDNYIIKKLFAIHYFPKNLSKKESYRRSFYLRNLKLKSSDLQRETYTTIEPLILKTTYANGSETFKFCKEYKKDKKIYLKINKSFKTLEEARQFKQEVLNGYHNQHNTVAA